MKRWIAAVLAFCAVALSGCGRGAEGIVPVSPTPEIVTTDDTTDKHAEQPTAAPDAPVTMEPTPTPLETMLAGAESFAAQGYSVWFTGAQDQSEGAVMSFYPYVDVYVVIEKGGVAFAREIAAERVVGMSFTSEEETQAETLARLGTDLPDGTLAGWQVYWAGVQNDFIATYDTAADKLVVWQRIAFEGGGDDGTEIEYGDFHPILLYPLSGNEKPERPYLLDDTLLDILMTVDEDALRVRFGFGDMPVTYDYGMDEESMQYPETRQLHVYGVNHLSALKGAQADMTPQEIIECMGYGSVELRWEDATYTETDAVLSYTIGPYCYTFFAYEEDGPCDLTVSPSAIYAAEVVKFELGGAEKEAGIYFFLEEYEPDVLLQVVADGRAFNIKLDDYDLEYSLWDGAQYAELAAGSNGRLYLHTYAARGSEDDAKVVEHYVLLRDALVGENDQVIANWFTYQLTDGAMLDFYNDDDQLTEEEYWALIVGKYTPIAGSRVYLR